MQKLVARTLAGLSRRSLEIPEHGEAAVLIPIIGGPENPLLLLTRRTETVATHKGQVSFPGGTRDPQDNTLMVTALRETHEELGLTSNQVEIVGAFHDYLAVTSVRVTPFVGFVKGRPALEPNPAEVAQVLEVPFNFFASNCPVVEEVRRDGQRREVYYYDYQGEVIWGLTAAIIKDFVDMLVGDGNPAD